MTVTLCAGTKKGKLADRGFRLLSAFPIPTGSSSEGLVCVGDASWVSLRAPSRRVSPVTSPRLRAQQGVASPPHPRARRGVRRPPRGLEQVLPLLRRWGPRPRQGPGPAAAWAPLAPRARGAPDFASALRVPRTDFFYDLVPLFSFVVYY